MKNETEKILKKFVIGAFYYHCGVYVNKISVLKTFCPKAVHFMKNRTEKFCQKSSHYVFLQ